MKIFNQCNIYISLWCIYYLQGALYPIGSIISQGSLAILLIVSIYNACYLNIHYKLPDYFKGLNLLLIILTLYGTISILNNEVIKLHYERVPNFYYLKIIYISLLPTYSAFLYTIKGQLTKKSLSIWILFWFIVATLQFNHEEHTRLLKYFRREEVTNNMGYVFLSLMPALILFNKKPLIQFSLLLYCISFIFMGMKRGAIIISILIFIYYINRLYKTSPKKLKIYILLSILFLIGTVFYIITDIISSSDYFNHRLEQTIDGDSSGRDIIFGKLWNHFVNETNILKILFGNGNYSTISIAGNYAHNDWLEILLNNGLVGIFIYIIYWYLFVKTWFKSKRFPDIYTALGMILISSFILTLFSMSYTGLKIYTTITLGFFIAISYKKQIK